MHGSLLEVGPYEPQTRIVNKRNEFRPRNRASAHEAVGFEEETDWSLGKPGPVAGNDRGVPSFHINVGKTQPLLEVET